jgi:hypothetical protein
MHKSLFFQLQQEEKSYTFKSSLSAREQTKMTRYVMRAKSDVFVGVACCLIIFCVATSFVDLSAGQLHNNNTPRLAAIAAGGPPYTRVLLTDYFQHKVVGSGGERGRRDRTDQHQIGSAETSFRPRALGGNNDGESIIDYRREDRKKKKKNIQKLACEEATLV